MEVSQAHRGGVFRGSPPDTCKHPLSFNLGVMRWRCSQSYTKQSIQLYKRYEFKQNLNNCPKRTHTKFLEAQQMKSKKLLSKEHLALCSSNLFRICLALKIASCCILQTGQGDGVFGLEADASNISFESIKCWQLEHDLIYFEFSSLCVSTDYSQNL